MAPRYEKYERQIRGSAQLRGPGQIDFAASRESERNANIVGAAADRMFNFAMRSVEKQAIHQGQRDAAKQPGATLEQFQTRAPQTAYEESAYTAAVNISAARISAEARSSMNEAWLDWNANWQRGEGYTPQDLIAKTNGITTGFSETIGALDPVVGEQVRGKLNQYAEGLYLDVSGTFLGEQAKQLAAESVALHDDTATDLQRYSRLDHGGATYFDGGLEVRLRNYAADQKLLGRDPDDVAMDVVKLRRQSHEDRVRGEYGRRPSIEDKQKYLDDFKADENYKKTARGLTSKQIKMLKGEMEDAPRQAAAKTARVARAVAQDAKEAFGNLAHGFSPGVALQRKWLKIANDTGDPDAVAAVNLLNAGVELKDRLNKMPVIAANDYVGRMRQGVAAGASGQAANLILLGDSINAAAEAAMRADQVTYHNTRVNQDKPWAALTTGDLNPLIPGNSEKIADRVAAVDAFATSMGNFDPIYFSSAEKQHFTTFFSSPEIAPETKLAAVTALNGASPDGSTRLLAQLSDNAGPMVVAATLASDGNDVAALQIMQGIEADGLGLKAEGEPGALAFGEKERAVIFDDLLRSGPVRAMQFDDKTIATTKSAAKMMYLGMYQNDFKAKENPEEYYTRAVQTTLGARYSDADITHGGIHEARKIGAVYGTNLTGHKVLLSSQMPVQHFRWLEDNLKGLTKEHLVAHDLVAEAHQGWPKVGNKGKDDARIEDLRQATFAPGSSPGWARLLTPQGDGYQDGYEVNLNQLYLLMTRKF